MLGDLGFQCGAGLLASRAMSHSGYSWRHCTPAISSIGEGCCFELEKQGEQVVMGVDSGDDELGVSVNLRLQPIRCHLADITGATCGHDCDCIAAITKNNPRCRRVLGFVHLGFHSLRGGDEAGAACPVSKLDVFPKLNEPNFGEFVMISGMEPVDRWPLQAPGLVALPKKVDLIQRKEIFNSLAAVIFVTDVSFRLAALDNCAKHCLEPIIKRVLLKPTMSAQTRSNLRLMRGLSLELMRVVGARRSAVILTLFSLGRVQHYASHSCGPLYGISFSVNPKKLRKRSRSPPPICPSAKRQMVER